MAQPDGACAQSSDPNEGPYRFTALSSKYAGQCVDSNRFRAIQNLKIDSTSVVLNNYHHANEFWEARFSIAPENVEAVYLQIVRFPILGVVEAAHTQIRFVLKKPVELTNQTTPSKKMTTQEKNFDLIRSGSTEGSTLQLRARRPFKLRNRGSRHDSSSTTC